METCPTIRIKPSHPSQGDFVLINEPDFDPAVHERLDAVEEAAPDLDAMRAEAEAAGVAVDARWGAKRLQAEIAKAGAAAEQ